SLDQFWLECVEAIESTEGVKASEGIFRFGRPGRSKAHGCEFFQERHRGLILFPDQHLLDFIALPAVGRIQSGHELRHGEFVQSSRHRWPMSGWKDAVNT